MRRDDCVPRGWRKLPGEHLERCGLSRTVDSEQTETLTLGHGDGNPPDRLENPAAATTVLFPKVSNHEAMQRGRRGTIRFLALSLDAFVLSLLLLLLLLFAATAITITTTSTSTSSSSIVEQVEAEEQCLPRGGA